MYRRSSTSCWVVEVVKSIWHDERLVSTTSTSASASVKQVVPRTTDVRSVSPHWLTIDCVPARRVQDTRMNQLNLTPTSLQSSLVLCHRMQNWRLLRSPRNMARRIRPACWFDIDRHMQSCVSLVSGRKTRIHLDNTSGIVTSYRPLMMKILIDIQQTLQGVWAISQG